MFERGRPRSDGLPRGWFGTCGRGAFGPWSLVGFVVLNETAWVTEPLVERLSQDECMALLSTVSIGRVGTTVDALPVVLPVTFGLLGGSIVFRTMPGTKLHDATLNAVVALQADHYANLHDPFGRSVLVQGMTQAIADPHRLAAARLLPLGSWAPDGCYLDLEPAIVSGRRVVI